MSYKHTVIVARFTEADAEDFKSKFPGAPVQPVITNRAEARKEARKIAEQEIADNEVITSLRQAVVTGYGWVYFATVEDKYPRS